MGRLGTWALKPFTVPAKPLDAEKAPTQLRGSLSLLAFNLTGHDADASLHTVTTSTTAVTTSAKAIYTAVAGLAVVFVSGYTTAYAKSFVDQVVINGTSNVAVAVSSTAVDGVPDARTYTVVAGVLKLTMAGGSYTVAVCPILLS